MSYRLGKCGICIKLKADGTNNKLPRATKDDALRRLREHLELTSKEKDQYHLRCAQAIRSNERIISIIGDGASPVSVSMNLVFAYHIDQILFPWVYPMPKDYLRTKRLRVNPYGFIDHGSSQRELWLHMGAWGKGSNVTFSLLLHHLLATKAFYSNGTYPPTLYYQVN